MPAVCHGGVDHGLTRLQQVLVIDHQTPIRHQPGERPLPPRHRLGWTTNPAAVLAVIVTAHRQVPRPNSWHHLKKALSAITSRTRANRCRTPANSQHPPSRSCTSAVVTSNAHTNPSESTQRNRLRPLTVFFPPRTYWGPSGWSSSPTGCPAAASRVSCAGRLTLGSAELGLWEERGDSLTLVVRQFGRVGFLALAPQVSPTPRADFKTYSQSVCPSLAVQRGVQFRDRRRCESDASAGRGSPRG